MSTVHLRRRNRQPDSVNAKDDDGDDVSSSSAASLSDYSFPNSSSTDFGTRSDVDSSRLLRHDDDDEVDVSSDDDEDETLHSNKSPLSHNDDASFFDPKSREDDDVSLPDFSSSSARTGSGGVIVVSGMTSPDSFNSTAEVSLPDLTSPEPPLRVSGREVRRAASLLRRDEDGQRGHSKSAAKHRRSLVDDKEDRVDDKIDDDYLLKLPSSDYSHFSRSSSPATGALRQISQRLCTSVTSLDSDASTTSLDSQSRSHRPRLSHHKRQKVEKILSTLQRDPSNVSAVRQLAISRCGLVSNDVRVLAWPKLLNIDPNRKLKKRSWEELTRHRDYNQVVLDVRRSLRRFPPGLTEEEQELLQVKLNTLILRVLCEHEELHYYQGYHDICVTFLLAVGEDLAFALMDRLSTHHLRDFMDATMERTTHLLNYLLPLVGRVNPALRDYVETASVGTVFSLSWLITWYGHVLNELKNIVRLYDFFLACHPLMPLYLAAAIVVHRERDILDTECDFAMLHCTLSKVPEDLPWETLISKAGDYFIQFPPSDLAAEAESQYQKGVVSRSESRAAAAARRGGGGGRGRGQLMTRNKDGVWIPLDQPKKVAARIVMWTLYASVGAAAYAVYTAGGFSWLWSGQ